MASTEATRIAATPFCKTHMLYYVKRNVIYSPSRKSLAKDATIIGICQSASLGRRTQRFNLSCPALKEDDIKVFSFTSEDARAAQLMNYKKEYELPEGQVVVQALNVPLIDQTAELLASSFITSVATLAPYAQYVRRNIRRYLHEHQALPPKAVVLVAVLHPFCAVPATAEAGVMTVVDPSISVADNGVEPASAASSLPRVIGSAEVSFDPSTRSPQMFVDAPEKCSYLCNMAVSIDFRRKGVATQLLSAAEELAATVMEEDAMYLHLRFVDADAAKLYEKAGFQQKARHWPLISLFGMQRMKLMYKRLAR